MAQPPVTYGTGAIPQQGYAQPVNPYQPVGSAPPAPGAYPPQNPYPQVPQQGYAPPATTPQWYQPPQKSSELQQVTEVFENQWEGWLLTAGCRQPLWFLFGCFCAPCAAFKQRTKLLMTDRDESNWQYYQCCAGIWGASATQKCNGCTRDKECFCLALESCCCLACAVHGNRFMIQVHYGLENTCCDIFLFWLVCICQFIALILQDDSFKNLADIIFYTLMGCMMAQHEDEMQKKGYPRIVAPTVGIPAPQTMA